MHEWSGYIDALVMYGAQHEFILDDRDVDEYNKNPKFEQFVHLGQGIQKLIIYSTIDSTIHIDRANLWHFPPSLWAVGTARARI